MDESADEVGRRLREAIAGLGRHRTQPLPQELHVEVERYAALRRRAGASWRTIAGSVGVSASALQRWGARERSPAARAGLRRVRVRREWVPSQTVASATLERKGSPYPVVTSGTRRAMMRACRDDGQGVGPQRTGRGRAPRCYDATRSRGSVTVPGFAMARRVASAR